MEALWQEMSKTPAEVEPPEWHLQALQEREQAIADGTDEFIPFEEFQALLEEETSQRKAR